MAQEKQKQKGQHGGPRPKVRPDDRRGWNTVGGSTPHLIAYQPTDEHRELVKTYAVVLTIPQLAKKLGISESTLLRHYRSEIDEAMATAVAAVGSKLFRSAMSGHFGAQVFFLKTRGKWSQRIELTGEDGGPVETRDLSVLSDDELGDLKRLLGRLAGVGDGEPEGGA